MLFKINSMKLNLKNKEIQKWLESRDWLYHYSGNGEHLFANFSSFNPKEGDIEDITKCQTTGFPKYSENHSWNNIDIEKEYMATYSMPVVHLKICSQRSGTDDFPYSLHIHFCHVRAGDDFEQVFYGYVNSVEELVDIFTMLGLNERHLK